MIKQASHPNYEMDLDTGKKVFVAEVKGFFKLEVGQLFIDDYNKVISKINPSEYTLVVDPETLKTASQDLIPTLKACYKLYESSKFKKVLMVTPSSAISAMQLRKVQKETGVEMEFVDSNPF